MSDELLTARKAPGEPCGAAQDLDVPRLYLDNIPGSPAVESRIHLESFKAHLVLHLETLESGRRVEGIGDGSGRWIKGCFQDGSRQRRRLLPPGEWAFKAKIRMHS